MRSPANVVVCLTNVSGKGWQLCILPQYGPVVPIEYTANNPHTNDLDGDGLPDFPMGEPEEEETPVEDIYDTEETEESEEQDMSEENSPAKPDADTIAALEKSLTATQPVEACERAMGLIRWLRNEGALNVRASGAIDPVVIASRYPHVHSLEELEYLLEVAEQMGIGKFVNEALTDFRLWQFIESAPVVLGRIRQPEPIVLFSNDDVESDECDEGDVIVSGELPTVDDIFSRDCRPEWMSDERLLYVRDLIMRDPDPRRYQKVRLLWEKSRFYKRSSSTGERELSKEQFLLILKMMAHPHVGLIEMDKGDDDTYRVLPSDEDLN